MWGFAAGERSLTQSRRHPMLLGGSSVDARERGDFVEVDDGDLDVYLEKLMATSGEGAR
jgi:hypothetical protein